ncbi:hypothetical protein VTK26DRAFT_4927 [Humicola hyalothermophila]
MCDVDAGISAACRRRPWALCCGRPVCLSLTNMPAIHGPQSWLSVLIEICPACRNLRNLLFASCGRRCRIAIRGIRRAEGSVSRCDRASETFWRRKQALPGEPGRGTREGERNPKKVTLGARPPWHRSGVGQLLDTTSSSLQLSGSVPCPTRPSTAYTRR